MRNLRRFVVPNHRRERGHKHQRALDELIDLLEIGLCSFDQELTKVRASVGHDRYRMGHVEDDQRLVDIHLQISTCATEANCYVVGHYLNSDHRERFGLCRVYLARHNRRAWLVLRNLQFCETRSWTA